MPFTFSHPAIVLPLLNTRRKSFSSTGLVIGSIIPDFESFIRFDQHKQYSHTWLGRFWFDLPLAIIIAFIFHNVVRDPLIKNLPTSIGSRFSNCLDLNWNAFFRKHFVMVMCSMLIGIVSHMLWDAFTHLNLADPNAVDSQIYVGPVRLFILLQYSNSLLGLMVVIWYVWKRVPIATDPALGDHYSGKALYWILVGAVSCLTILLASTLIDEELNVILLIEIAISGTLLALIVAPFLQRLLFSRPKGRRV